MKEIIFPQSLKKGDKIAIISPAGSVEEAQLQQGINLIEAHGYEPVLGKHVYTKYVHGYNYAGTEQERTQDLNWAFSCKEIKAVWASRGGYGCQHLIQGLRKKELLKQPKWYIGYSDNTVIQSYLLKHGIASIHAQTIKTSSFGVCDEAYEGIFDILKGKLPAYTLEGNSFNIKGSAEGLLVGGNLALVYALLGSSYSFNFKDKILFIEEIGENYYSLDRMLMGLELAGVFKKIKGLIIGGLTNMGKENENPHYEESFDPFAKKIVAERVRKYNFPVVFDFPNGHIFDNRPLIIGSEVQMKVGKKVTIYCKH